MQGTLKDAGSIPGLGRSPGERNGNPLQYSCLGNPIDREIWLATAHGIAKIWTERPNHYDHSWQGRTYMWRLGAPRMASLGSSQRCAVCLCAWQGQSSKNICIYSCWLSPLEASLYLFPWDHGSVLRIQSWVFGWAEDWQLESRSLVL